MKANRLAGLSIQQLKRALRIRERLSSLEKQLARLLGANASATKGSSRRQQRRTNAAGKARRSRALQVGRNAGRISTKPRRIAGSGGRLSAGARKPSPRGQLKQRILKNLKAAGNSGVTVKDLAAKTGRSYGNISVWFHTTAKGVKEIRKIAPGTFAWSG